MMFSKKEAIGFCCDRLPNGGPTYSLTTWLGELLTKAEKQYGPRDLRWTLLGIEFFDPLPDKPRPQIWGPGGIDHIAIRLTESARLDPDEAVFQMAHEIIHLLAPTKEAKVIEEGLATIFSHQNSTKRNPCPKYLKAEKLTQELLDRDPEAIIKLRKDKPSFTDFTAKFLTDVYSNLPSETAIALCENFDTATECLPENVTARSSSIPE